MLRSLLAALLLAACHATTPPPAAPVPTVAAPAPTPAAATASDEMYADANHEDLIVGSFMGMDDIAMKRIGEVFGRYHIRWSAYGSLGYTLIVQTSQGALARALLKDDPVLAQRVSRLP